jgi:hypothetical protein
MARHERQTGLFSHPDVRGYKSLLNIQEVIMRIRHAGMGSPIIVYEGQPTSTFSTTYRTGFGNTVRGEIDIETGYGRHGERVIGAFDNTYSNEYLHRLFNQYWDRKHMELPGASR